MLACGNLLNHFVASPFRDKGNKFLDKSSYMAIKETSLEKIHKWRHG